MSAKIIEIADALVADINEQIADTEGFEFTAERTYFERYQLAQLDVLHVNVTMHEEQADELSREAEKYHFSLNVVVQKKVKPEDVEQMDGLTNLVDAISDLYKIGITELLPGVLLVEKRKNPICNPKYLETDRRFFSVLSLVWFYMGA